MNNIPDAGLVDNWTVGQIIFLSVPPTRDFRNLSHKIAELARQKFDQYVNHVVQTRDRGALVIYLEKGKRQGKKRCFHFPMSLRRETYRDYLATPLSPSATMHIEGNASQELKEVPLKWYNIFRTMGEGGFGCEAGKRIVVKEVSIQPTVDDPSKTEARLVCEIEVTAGALQRR